MNQKMIRQRICALIREGNGIDDIHVQTGLPYGKIWYALSRSAAYSHRLRPWAAIALRRAVAEADGRRGAA